MPTPEALTISDLVPTLKGTSNFKAWYTNMEVFMVAREPKLWQIFTGKLSRPADINVSNATAAAAAVKEIQDSINEKVAIRNATTLLEDKPIEIVTAPTITIDIAVKIRDLNQEEWDSYDRAIIAYVRATIAPDIAVLIAEGARSATIHTQLKEAWGTISKQEAFHKYNVFMNLVYKGSKPEDFVKKWRQHLKGVLDTFPSGETLSWIIPYHQFMRAASYTKECHPFLNNVKLDTEKSLPQNLESLTTAFISFEERRLTLKGGQNHCWS